VVRKICARCGRPEEPGRPFIGNLCLECYLEEKGVAKLPGEIEVTICPRCGSLRVQGAWLPPEGSIEETLRAAVEAEILSKAKPNPEVREIWVENIVVRMEDRNRGVARVLLGARFHGGIEARYEAIIPLRVKHVLCPSCLRKAGKAYEAILQLRGEDGRLSDDERREVSRLLRRLPRHLYDTIGEVEEKREGLDLKILDQASARSIASKLRNRLAAKVVETHKVVGRRGGKAKVQTTILVRIPRIREGDIVIYKDRPAVVKGISGNRIILEEAGGRRTSLSGEEFWESGGLEIVGEKEVKVLMVTAITRDLIYLLDMDNYSTLDIPLSKARLAGTLKPGDKVKAVMRSGELHILGKI